MGPQLVVCLVRSEVQERTAVTPRRLKLRSVIIPGRELKGRSQFLIPINSSTSPS